jgi:nucleotide-binding universal stress UspA family protein
MKRLRKILVPTDLSENSRRAISYGCWLAAEENAELIVLHVAKNVDAWEFCPDEFGFPGSNGKPWPLDRLLAERGLDLSRFLEPSMGDLKRTPSATKRVTLGSVPEEIAAVAEEIHADLIVMSPRRRGSLRRILFASVTDTVTRTSPCPVLSLAPVRPSEPWRGESIPARLAWTRRPTPNI